MGGKPAILWMDEIEVHKLSLSGVYDQISIVGNIQATND